MFRTIVKVIVVLLLIIAAGIGLVFYLTSGMAEQAESFFAKVKQNKIDEAYSSLSSNFRAHTSLDQLKTFVSENSLNEYTGANWSSRSINTSGGKLEGSVELTGQKTVPLKIDFVKEQGEWKILGISRGQAGLTDNSATTASQPIVVPDNDSAVKLARESMKVFGEAVDKRDMSIFHKHISLPWQEQFTVEKLETAYKPLYEIPSKFGALEEIVPVFSKPPFLAENNVLNIDGYFPTSPQQVVFNHKYIMQGGEWKLLGLTISIRDTPKP